MKRWDLHCDVLCKLMMDRSIRFEDDPRLDVTCRRLRAGGVQFQAFAIYIPEVWHRKPFDAVLESIDAFQQYIASHPDILPVRNKTDLEKLLRPGEKRIGALLTLEGADGLEGNFTYLRIAHKLGVRTLGITWNHANWAADGVGEPRGGGFTEKGRQLVQECEGLNLPLDISHISERAFWELCELSAQPFIASHSNAKAICGHARNLTDDQIKEIIARNGRIGITFVPYFLREDGKTASVNDILRHLEHICSLGGENHVGFGSDFDGITEWVQGLEHPGYYENLENELQKNFSDHTTSGFFWKNWLSYYREHLPDLD